MPLKLIGCVSATNFTMPCCADAAATYLASHLAKEPLVSFPQFPYGSPAELTRSKQIPGAGFAPIITEGRKKHILELFLIQWRLMSGWFTCPPQGDALLLVSLADAVVAVAFNAVTGVPVVQIDVGGAVRAGARAELWQVTGVTGLSTQGASWFQLEANIYITSDSNNVNHTFM